MFHRRIHILLGILLVFLQQAIGQTRQDESENDLIVPIDLSQQNLSLVFDSIKTSDFFPLFNYSPVTYKKENNFSFKQTYFEKKNKKRQDDEKLQRQMINRLSLDHPEIIDYYDLKPYDYSLERAEAGEMNLRLEGLEEKMTLSEKLDLKKYMKIKKENPLWKFYGELSLQFSQYYVTDNWSKGGTPNATFLTLFDYHIDYQKERLLWENEFDVQIGFYNTSKDTIRAFRVNNDLCQLTSLLAYQTWFSKKVYYSAAVDFKTSLFTGYSGTNSNTVVTAFLSPSRIYYSLGMECRYNNKVSVRLAPVAYKFIFSIDDRVNPLHVGLDSTQTHKGWWGYLLQAKLDWKFSKEINLASKITFFSSYTAKNIDLDWRVTGKFIINRYLSARLSLIMLYDNTPLDEKAQIQVQEQLSFGFKYTFR